MRILLIASIAALAWVVFTLFSASSPAAAGEEPETGGPLLGAVTAAAAELAPIPASPEPLTTIVQTANQPADIVTTNVAEPVLTGPVSPVIEEPVINSTVQFVNDLAAESTASLTELLRASDLVSDAPTSAAATPFVVVAGEPEPVAVTLTFTASDTRAAHVPAAGSPHVPVELIAPIAPTSAPSPAPTQGTGAPSLIASLPTSFDAIALARACGTWVNFPLPPSPSFDSDTSPD